MLYPVLVIPTHRARSVRMGKTVPLVLSTALGLRPRRASHVQYCQIDSIRQNNILFVVDRKIAFHLREVDKVLSIRSIHSICQMEKFTIDSTSAVVDRTIASH